MKIRAREPEQAKKILDSAVQDAGTSGRTVFHASWCG
jgi:hypothetical protein